MPLSGKKVVVAASYTSTGGGGGGGVRIPKSTLVACLTCPLCNNLFREATTISECLHTFCRECIHSCLSDGETNSCPMCNVSLGTLPLEKLRVDHQLEDVKVKIFPDLSRKRKNGPGSSPAVSSAVGPLRRKERSLYSLGIGAQPSLANPGFATRTTRRSSGKSVAGRDSSSSDDDEHEADEMDEEDGEPTEDDEGPENHGSGFPESSSPNAAGYVRGSDYELDDSSDEEILPPRPSRAKEEPRRAPIKDAAPMTSSDLGLYLARRSVLTANGFAQPRSGNGTDGVAPAGNSVGGTQEVADSLLATLAEVAGADSVHPSRAVKSNQAEQPYSTPQGQPAAAPELTRVRDANNDAKSLETRPSQATSQGPGSTTQHPSPPRARRSSPQLQRNPSLKLFVNGGAERPAILKHPTQPPPPANGSHLASTSFAPSSCGIWFALQAARNQSDNPLPQLSSPYLRIKDGKLPVSHVKKYLVKKLGLNNETEVEITCRGQPVVSSLPLESVRNIWFATAAVPNSKDQEDQGQTAPSETTTGLVHLDTSSAKELIMVLTYQRHRRNSRIC
ncbi:unnamed protein product [Calypogeia fissa]